MKVSVIVPTFNRSSKLVETIQSIENCNFSSKDFEVIIIDDLSTDDTEEKVNNLEVKYKNIIYIKNRKNLGPAGARNNGIKRARGKYLLFTDDDCLVPKDWIKEYVSFFEKNKNVAGIGGLLQPISNNIIARMEMFKDKVLGIKMTKTKIGRKEIPAGFTNNAAYRKDVFLKIGYFNENFKVPAGEDTEFKNRVAEKYDVAFIPISVVHNQDYNLDYLLGLVFKQGLEKMPPKSFSKKVIILILYSPLLVFNIIKKVLTYRNKK